MPEQAKSRLAARPDLMEIFRMIPAESRVLDLGCGNGDLLLLLRAEKNVYGYGVEISQENILACVAAGVPVLHADLNQGLQDFPDDAFDYVVLSQTLQAVVRPDHLLGEMARVGRKVLISFINIGYWHARWQIAACGHMPVTATLPHQWHDTPNIHLGTIRDFRTLCRAQGRKICREVPLGVRARLAARLWPNLFSPTCVFEVE
jgi:methionine biosynthesis protein MetW